VDLAVLKARFAIEEIRAQLPDAMELVAQALRAGHSLAAGLHVVAEEMPDPIAKEFRRVYDEQNLGVSLEEAESYVRSSAEPRPAILRDFGRHSTADRRRSCGNPRSNWSCDPRAVQDSWAGQGPDGGRTASGIVLIALPIGLFLLMLFMKPDYIRLLWTEEMGIKMSIGAIVLMLGAPLRSRRLWTSRYSDLP
jgi:tight adherence protein B